MSEIVNTGIVYVLTNPAMLSPEHVKLSMNTVLTNNPVTVDTPSSLDNDTKRAVSSFMTHLADAKLPAVSRVLLYGSRARGDYHADSDVDIAVVLTGGNPGGDARYDLQMLLSEVRSRAILHTNMSVSAIVVWDAELREPDKQRNPAFYRNVRGEEISIRPCRPQDPSWPE